jgi:hypothetical protein
MGKIPQRSDHEAPVWPVRTYGMRSERHQLLATSRALHSSTSQLNLSAFYGIGGARRGCVAHVKGVLKGVQGV